MTLVADLEARARWLRELRRYDPDATPRQLRGRSVAETIREALADEVLLEDGRRVTVADALELTTQ